MLDVGLLGAQSNLSAQIIIDGNELFTEFKGALTENYVCTRIKMHQTSESLLLDKPRNCRSGFSALKEIMKSFL